MSEKRVIPLYLGRKTKELLWCRAGAYCMRITIKKLTINIKYLLTYLKYSPIMKIEDKM